MQEPMNITLHDLEARLEQQSANSNKQECSNEIPTDI